MVKAGARFALVFCLTACGTPPEPPVPDAGCGELGTPSDMPYIMCPSEIDLGCIGPEGVTLDVAATAGSCDGAEPTLVCNPGAGATIRAGSPSEGTCVARSPSGAVAECTFAIRYAIDGPAELACGDALSATCSASRTNVTLEPPTAMASCSGGRVDPATHDAPADGFAVGLTTVTWTAAVEGGAPLSCTVDVTIDDDTPPALRCDPSTFARTAPGDAITPPLPTATDRCDTEVLVDMVLPTERGAHVVPVTATDDAGLEATCDWALTVLDVFAPTGLRVLSAELAADGTTDLSVGWDPVTSPDVTALRLERATSLAGPWTTLSTLPATTLTFTDGVMPMPEAHYRVVALAGALEGGATDPLRALAVTDDEYHLVSQPVSGVPFATSLFGVVRHPVDLAAGPFPLVVFLHGNHGNCRSAAGLDGCESRTGHECEDPSYTTTPNAHGYVYLQETLASQGFMTVSISANALNCRPDYIPERTALLLEHLRRWARWGTTGAAPFGTTFAGVIDLTRVSLVGHSRGGEAVASAPAALASTPVAGVSLAGVFTIGPTDFHSPRPSGVPYATLLPGCDADVRTLVGLRQYDRGLDAGDPNARAQILYIGANHNFFNTEWRVDDNEAIGRACDAGDLVGGPAQRGMLEPVLSDWIRSTTAGSRFPAYIRAESDTPPLIDAWAARDIDLRWSYAAASRRALDDFTGAGAPDFNDAGGANTYSGMIASITCTGTCRRNFTHVTGAIRPAWDPSARATFAVGDLDASLYDVVSMRFASRIATINSSIFEHDFAIRVRDRSGTTAEVLLAAYGRLPHRYPSRFEQEVLTTVRIPFTAFLAAAPTLDPAHLSAVEVSWPGTGPAAGSIWMSDLDLASD